MSSPRSAVGELYRRSWALTWSLVSTLGVLLATAEWSIPAVVGGLLLDTVLVATVLTGLHTFLGAREPEARRSPTRVLRVSSAGVCGAVAVAAVSDVAPALGAAGAFTALVTSPVVLDRLLPWLPYPGDDHEDDPHHRLHV